MVVKTSIFVKAKFPKSLCNVTAICAYELVDKSDPGPMAYKSKINLGPTPFSITLRARGVFSRGTFPPIVTAQQLLVTSSSRIFCRYFTHVYYNAINLVSLRTIFKTPELQKRKFSTYLTMLHCCSFFSLPFYKGNVFRRTGDNTTMTQVLPVREYFKGTSVMCKEVSH